MDMLSMVRSKLNPIKIQYSLRIYIYLVLLIAIFAISITCLFLNRTKELKKEISEKNLSVYAELIDDYLKCESNYVGIATVEDLLPYFPKEIRISVFNEDRSILYDNVAPREDWEKIANESRNNVGVIRAFLYGSGNYIRKDKYHNNENYHFYSLYKNDHIIRVALPYIPVDKAQESDMILLRLSGVLFLITIFVLSLFYLNVRRSIKKLKIFVSSLIRDRGSLKYETMQETELSEVQLMIVDIYKELASKEKDTQIEREKLLEHFNFAEEGISFFTAGNKNVYTNVHFIQYLSILLNETVFDVQSIFKNPIFSDIIHFLNNRGTSKSYNSNLYGNGKIFGIHVIIFDDNSYEIIIRKITDAEREEMDAAAITNNIAHELRTPVTSMRGYLETILEVENMSTEKQKLFLEKAYKQCIRLSEIIQNLILLSKTTYAPQYFLIENINLNKLICEIIDDAKELIETNHSVIEVMVAENTIIKGNRTLLSSIFRNLLTNAIKYAGLGTIITIKNYLTDDNYFYFSFADNGKGIAKKHIDHIFDRFYRVSDGRTRDSGGSGLGLSIVKDAVQFHRGEIYVKNRLEGGLEFIFSLRISS